MRRDEKLTLGSIPLPDGWSIEVKQRWTAAARSADGEQGVEAYGDTPEEAVRALRRRMTDWADMLRREESRPTWGGY